MTPEDLVALGVRLDRATEHAPYLRAAMDEFDINTPQRQAAFLAQILHESGMLRYSVELWGPTGAQRSYGNRMGNANDEEGYKYRGRGWIQVTGHDNYAAASNALGVNLLSYPELLGEAELAARSAGWFWKSHGLNELADGGDQERICKRVNGGLTGYPERLALYDRAQEVLA